MATQLPKKVDLETANELLPELLQSARLPQPDPDQPSKSIVQFNALRILYQAQHGLHSHPFFQTVNTNLLSTPLYILPKFKWVVGDKISSQRVFESIYTKHPSTSKKGSIVSNKSWELLSHFFSTSSLSFRLHSAIHSAPFSTMPNLTEVQNANQNGKMLPHWPNISHATYPIANSSRKRDKVPYILQPCVDYYIVIDYECTCLPKKDQLKKAAGKDGDNPESNINNIAISTDDDIGAGVPAISPPPSKSLSPGSSRKTSKEPKIKAKKKGQRGYQPSGKMTSSSKSDKALNGADLNSNNSTSSHVSNSSIEIESESEDSRNTTNVAEATTPESAISNLNDDGESIEHQDYPISSSSDPANVPSSEQQQQQQQRQQQDNLSFPPDAIDPNNGTFQHEIIEFPAILVNARDLTIVSIFHSYVKPTIHPILSQFCIELTGITQAQVDAAPTIDLVMLFFINWLKDYGIVFHNTSLVFQSLLSSLSSLPPLSSVAPQTKPDTTTTPTQPHSSSPPPRSFSAPFTTLHSILNSAFLPSIPNLALDSPLDSLIAGDRKFSPHVERKDNYVSFNKMAEFSYLTQYPALLPHLETLHTQPPNFPNPTTTLVHNGDGDDGDDDHFDRNSSSKSKKQLQKVLILDAPDDNASSATPESSHVKNLPKIAQCHLDDSLSDLEALYRFIDNNFVTTSSLSDQITTAVGFLPLYTEFLQNQTTLQQQQREQREPAQTHNFFSQLFSQHQSSLQPAQLTLPSKPPSEPTLPPLQPSKFDRFEYFLHTLQSMHDLIQSQSTIKNQPVHSQLSTLLSHYSKSTTIIHSQVVPHHQSPPPPPQSPTTPSTTTNPSNQNKPSTANVRTHTALLVSDGPADFLNFLTPELRRKGLHWLLIYLFGITNTSSLAPADHLNKVADSNAQSPLQPASTAQIGHTIKSIHTPRNPDFTTQQQSGSGGVNPDVQQQTSQERELETQRQFKLSCLPPPVYFDTVEKVAQIHVESNLYYCNIRHVLYQVAIYSKGLTDNNPVTFSASFPNNLSPVSTISEHLPMYESTRSSIHKPFLSTLFPSEYTQSSLSPLIQRLTDSSLLPHVTTHSDIPQHFLQQPKQQPTSIPPLIPHRHHHIQLAALSQPILNSTALLLPLVTYKFEQAAITPWKLFIGKYTGGGVPHFLKLFNLIFIGHLHSGINDSINITRILYHICLHSDYVLGFTGIGAI